MYFFDYWVLCYDYICLVIFVCIGGYLRYVEFFSFLIVLFILYFGEMLNFIMYLSVVCMVDICQFN